MTPEKLRGVAKRLEPMATQILYVTGKGDDLVDRVERPHDDRQPVHVMEPNRGQHHSLGDAIAKIRRAEQRNRESKICRQRNLGRTQDELDLLAQIVEPAAAGIEHYPVGENDAGFEAATDLLNLRQQGVVALIVSPQCRLIERLDATEQPFATSLADNGEVFGSAEKVAGDQGRPAANLLLVVHLLEKRDPGQKEIAIVAVKVIVEKDQALLSGGLDLPSNITEVVDAVTPPLRRQ